jgi:hypothetical protein
MGGEEEGDVGEDGGAGGVGECYGVQGEFASAAGGDDFAKGCRGASGVFWSARGRGGCCGWGLRLGLCLGGGGGVVGINESEEGYHGKFAFGEGDELQDAYLHIAHSDETCPEHGHDIAFFDEFSAEPESFDEHPQHHELRHSRSQTPQCIQSFSRSVHAVQHGRECGMLVWGSVEGFDCSDGGYSAVDECGGCSCLRALDCEEGACKGLGEGLDEHEDVDCGEDDEGECPGVLEGEDKACDAGCEISEEHPGC